MTENTTVISLTEPFLDIKRITIPNIPSGTPTEDGYKISKFLSCGKTNKPIDQTRKKNS